MPNPGLPMRYFEKSHTDTKRARFEQTMLGRQKIRGIVLLFAISGHL